ncbi:expressed unknown protein [Seminavis robusta]|uniref:Uncharacterized protein n=1 Tax=Seminavis robusta TaxID=568900 RepID=A0A9N8HG01_9STRA|nr:expressed unknown protein [Seminavis robusta]|eukprot:Sro374_g129270.1 n/a (82) ;mRNA; r:47844-48089
MEHHQDDDDGEEPTVVRLQRECEAMMKLLTRLEQEELDLKAQNEILARMALNCGCSPALLEPPAPKRRRTNKSANAANKEK